MKKNLPYILIAIILIIVGFFAYKSYQSNKSYPSYSADNQQNSKETKKALETAQSQMQKPEEQNNYTHPDPNFSFQYPKTMNAASFEEGEGETVLLQGQGGALGMQIYISD